LLVYDKIEFLFDNLVINNRQSLLKILGISSDIIVNDGPYFQKETRRNRGCQIDYLIQTKSNELYVIEVKFSRRELSKSIIGEMKRRIDALIKPKHTAIRPVLIHINGVSEETLEDYYFYQIIDFTMLLN